MIKIQNIIKLPDSQISWYSCNWIISSCRLSNTYISVVVRYILSNHKLIFRYNWNKWRCRTETEIYRSKDDSLNNCSICTNPVNIRSSQTKIHNPCCLVLKNLKRSKYLAVIWNLNIKYFSPFNKPSLTFSSHCIWKYTVTRILWIWSIFKI